MGYFLCTILYIVIFPFLYILIVSLTEPFIIKKYDTKLAKEIYNDKYIDYHIEFFKAGLNAIVRKWLENECKENPEEINQILKDEYKNKNINYSN